MAAHERRQELLGLLATATSPLSGGRLATKLGVSRQVIVNDVAVLRAGGARIVPTARGYVLEATPGGGAPRADRELPTERVAVLATLKLRHTVDQTADELECVLANGGEVVDVSVRHRVYGTITAPLNIATRDDALRFLDDIKGGKSEPLLSVTSGYHYHTIAASSEAALDRIERALDAKGYLAPLLPYER